MDLLNLAAKITLDDSSYTKGIKNAETMGQQLAGKMSAMTVAVGNVMADVMRKSVSAISGIVTGAIDSYADYQQLIGGVETLFKTSADKVANYAKQSFKNTGLSANEYMETVTSFSASLLQGLNGNTEAAADIANTAIQDMADNANKMGTDIGSIQAAYMGFAKQNYTMLDNLKLGYGGTASEMIRLVNDSGILEEEITSLDGITFDQLVAAIHQIQTEMDITGTTAKEAASTISGSKASLKAAWQDMLSAVGGEGDQARMDEAMENFKTSFTTYMENFIPTLVTTISNSGSLVTAIAESISSLPTDLLSKIGTEGLSAGAEMIGGVGKIAGWLIDSLVNMFENISIDSSKVTEFGTAIGTFIGDTLSRIAVDLPTIVDGMFTFGVSLASGIMKGIWSGLFGDDANGELEKIQTELESKISSVEISSTRAEGILNYMQGLIDKYGEAAKDTEDWARAEDDLEGVLGGSKATFEQYGNDIQGAVTHLQAMNEQLRKIAIEQAFEEKRVSQYKLLGEYEAALSEAQYQAGSAQSTMNSLEARRVATAVAYAQELLTNGYLEEGSSEWYTAKQTVENPEYAGTGLDVLASKIADMYEDMGMKESEWIWNKDEFDNVISPETLEDIDNEYARQKQALEDANKAVEEAKEGISKTNDAIALTEASMANLKQELDAAAWAAGIAASALSSVGGSGDGSSGFVDGGGTGRNVGRNISFAMPRAVGLDFAPYNGFKTELHRGDCVEIGTSEDVVPKPEWLEYAKTYKARRRLHDLLKDRNMPDYKICPKCKPLPGEEVIGFKGADGVITVHSRHCPEAIKLASENGNSLVSVAFDPVPDRLYPVRIRIVAIDRYHLLRDIIDCFVERQHLSMNKLLTHTEDEIVECIIDFPVHSVDELHLTMESISEINGVDEVQRVI